MKMIIIIVKDNDADTLTQAFTAGNFRGDARCIHGRLYAQWSCDDVTGCGG